MSSLFKFFSSYLLAGRFCLFFLSLFYIHFSFGNLSGHLEEADNVSKEVKNAGKVIKALTQVMGQSEAECGTEYEDIRPTNEDFCSDLSMPIFNCPALPMSASPTCDQFVTNIADTMGKIDTAVENTLKNGNAVCHCCMVPSICLLGGIGRVIDLLRVGNYAGLLLGLNNNKICAAIEKTQHASMALDAMSGGKCIHKGGRCKKNHGVCVEELNNIILNIEKFQCPNGMGSSIAAETACQNEIGNIENYISELESSSNQKCTAASKAGQSQLALAALTGVASLVARECRKDYERNTKCDDKKDIELDECCERHPRADACKNDTCEGKEGEDLTNCCSANPHSALCANVVDPSDPSNVCRAAQLTNNPSLCMDQCRENPSLPGCRDFCNLYWNREVCAEVCKHYEMFRCAEITPDPGNACESNSEDPCCVNPNGPECKQFCETNLEAAVCQCAGNVGRCRCDREEDIPYMPAGQCTTELTSTDCEDPEDPLCAVGEADSGNFAVSDSKRSDAGGSTGTPWVGPPPFPDGSDNSGNPKTPSSPSSYSSGGGGSGSGGGLGGGGFGGGFRGGSSYGGEGEDLGEDGEDPYENILAGLSGNQNQSSGYSGGSGARSARSSSGSGFDLKKFLPKKKKSKKDNKSNDTNRAPSSMDSIFDLSSEVIGRYCVNNNINCIRK